MAKSKRVPVCRSQCVGETWVQEMYETATRDAGLRARQLRSMGFAVTCETMGMQTTSVGRVALTALTIRKAAGEVVPEVKVEPI